ncbi:hypothetical protein N7560_05210, partial [Stenotrophomonas maltophilia]|uniref:hypothetical protein n=1 Tax=Stenotrophomonas maltophilia TaxID=40324 RepID=UPI0024496F16
EGALCAGMQSALRFAIALVVPAAGRQPHDLRGVAWLPASGRHYQSMFSTAIRCSAPLARASAVVGPV